LSEECAVVTIKDVYEIGEVPPVGEVPKYMYGQLIRPERFGEPKDAFQKEKVETPVDLKPREALVMVMAAGINFNNVWAARGIPVNVIKAREKEGDTTGFHIGGSDASGIVYAVGDKVTNVKVGDRVVIHCGMWDEDAPFVQAGNDPMFDPSFKIWGYESNWGSFAQFTKVQAHQCLPKAPHLTWEEAAAPTLVGATAYRMLMGWPPNTVKPGDPVLVWGGSGGLGSMAIQIVKQMGGIPIAVVSSEDKFEFCMKLGAKGCINRKEFDHWGMMPHWTDDAAYGKWAAGARAVGAKIWEILGERKSPRIVFDHPGEDTVPTSIFVCDTGGMVVICAGTSGFNATVDLRYLWMRQKRFQGSHFANDEQSAAFNQLVLDGKIDPCLGKTYSFDEIGLCHQLMFEGKQPLGVMAALVNAKTTGEKDL
jgi:crotonyl-CoA carboxylase/reductase